MPYPIKRRRKHKLSTERSIWDRRIPASLADAGQIISLAERFGLTERNGE